MAPHLARTLPGGSGLRPEVPVPRSTDRLLPGFVETFCGAGLRPGPAIRTRRRGTIRRFLRLSSHLGGLTLIPTRRPYWIAQLRRPRDQPAIREDVAEVAVAVVDLTPHHPLDRIVAGVQIGREEWLHRRELPWRIYLRRALALPSLDYYRLCTARVHPRRGAGYRPPSLRRERACRRDLCHQLTSPPRAGRYRRQRTHGAPWPSAAGRAWNRARVRRRSRRDQ